MIKNVIYIGGVARSGTSWIGQILNSSPEVTFRFQPLFSYEFRGKIDENSSAQDYQVFYHELFNTSTDFLTQRDKIKSGVYPSFTKSNQSILAFKENRFQSIIEPMLRKSPNLHFVGVIRNPNATLYSWSQNEKEFPPDADILKEWRFANCKNLNNEDYFGYYKWKEVANLYIDLKSKYHNRVHIIHYDKFVNNTIEIVKTLFKNCDLAYTAQTDKFLSESLKGSDRNYYSVFKGNIDRLQWKTKLPSYITNEIIQDLKGTRLEVFLD
jgi:Sulfotransferase family